MTQPRIVPAISIWQPWASLIITGLKPFETCSYPAPSNLIGRRVAIHASNHCMTRLDEPVIAAVDTRFGPDWPDTLPRNAVLGTVLLLGCIMASEVPADPFGDYAPDRFAWAMGGLLPFDPPVTAFARQGVGWPWVPPEGLSVDAREAV